MQSRSTRDNHVRDDERSQLVSEREGLPAMSTSSSTGEPARNRYTRINDEVDLLMSFPTTSFLRPLVFRHPPEENGEFIWPNPLDPPNQGVFALTNNAANRKFLSTENRLFDLLTDIDKTHDNSKDSGALLNHIQMELRRLTREKQVQWTQQRGNSGIGPPYIINTGISPLYFASETYLTIRVLRDLLSEGWPQECSGKRCIADLLRHAKHILHPHLRSPCVTRRIKRSSNRKRGVPFHCRFHSPRPLTDVSTF